VLMMSTNNIFSPANGNPIITPSQDIVMGCYWLTASRGEEGEKVEAGEGMLFHSPGELFQAYAEGKLGIHARVQVRLPLEKPVISEVKDERGQSKPEEIPRKANGLVRTTVGRVIFNDILHPKMAFYDLALGSKYLSRIIADCYQLLGRRETISLLDRMKEIGFKESTKSGLSFASSDLKTPEGKDAILREKEKEVEKLRKQYERGTIANDERYNKTIEAWNKAREMITKQLMIELAQDRRADDTGRVVPYLNPIYLMAISGARGGVEQIRQLAGLRGLMSKPSGEIIETPIKSNFREGLTVLEYFSSTHGARKGLADTALKTADSGYLTRKLADVAQNVVITMYDCGTTQGVTKGIMYKGQEIDRPLYDAIRGRVSRNTIPHPQTGEPMVEENEMISPEKARLLERLGIDKVTVRSPLTCQASLGVCRQCYGMDLSTGALVEEGMAVGIIAAQSIGEPGTQLTMRTFHLGGIGQIANVETEYKCRKGGVVALERITVVINEQGQRIALARTGEILVLRPKDREIIERYSVPNGSELKVEDGQTVEPNTLLCNWDPSAIPIICEEAGKVRFEDMKEGVTVRREQNSAGIMQYTIMEHKGDMHPQVRIEDGKGNLLRAYFIPERANVTVKDGETVTAGTLLAKTTREQSKTQDITGGLPRVTELFEARRPRNPAVMAEVSGRVRQGDRKRGKRIIWVQPVTDDGKETGEEREHAVPAGAQLRVTPGEYVKVGDPLVYGPLVPHDILRVRGIEAVQDYMVREVQAVYRLQRVDIDDKHIEVIVSQMLRKVKVTTAGDTKLLPGLVLDKFTFEDINRQHVEDCVKVVNPGASGFYAGQVLSREAFEEERATLSATGKKKDLPTFETPTPADMEVQLLGITKAAVQSDSFISAASFQETTKVLTEAALASKVDYLVGLKENVILGHLIPAGTGFKLHQEAQVQINGPAPYQGHGRRRDN